MRVLRSIVEVLVLAMLHSRQDLAFRSPITPELIGNDHTRNVLQTFEQLAKEAVGREASELRMRRETGRH